MSLAEDIGNPGQLKMAQPLAMIVEDEALIGFGLEDSLRDLGLDVVGPFATCAAALESLSTGALPSVAILDAVLRDGTCLDLARELVARSVPFLIYSGRDEFEEGAPELDGVTWIEKPRPPESVAKAALALLSPSSRPCAVPLTIE